MTAQLHQTVDSSTKNSNVAFRVLSTKEEARLSPQDKEDYYREFRAWILSRQLKTTTPGARFWGPKLKKITNKIAIAVTKAFTNKNIDWVVDGTENIPDGSIIFALSHQGLLDNFVWLPSIDRHCCILHGAGVNKLLLLCQMNTGLVLVKKGDAQNNLDAKLDAIRLLLEGHSITWFPEGTWNLSPNKLHLPMRHGFLDAARKTGRPVVPGVIEYTYDTSTAKERITKIHIRYGRPIFVTMDDNLAEKLEEYEEAISTMRYELIEEKGLFKRSDISNREYINFIKGCLANLKLGKLDINSERKFIFGAEDEYYQFHHINDVPFNEFDELLEPEEAAKLAVHHNENKLEQTCEGIE